MPVYPEAILFDMDDTILLEDAASQRAWQETCTSFAEKTGLCSGDELLGRVRELSGWFWSDPGRRKGAVASFYRARLTYVKLALSGLGCDDENTAHGMVMAFTARKDELIGFLPHAEETIREIAGKRVRLALLTNGDGKVQREKVERFGLSRYFPVCLIEGEIGFGKPDPRVFQTALERLGVSADRAWMVGDLLETDIIGAKALGIYAIWCDHERKGLPPDAPIVPDRIITDISELLALVDNRP